MGILITVQTVMSRRQRQARETLEIYLIHLILAYRYLILTSGMLTLVFAVAVTYTNTNSYGGLVVLLPATFLLLLGGSYKVVLFTARLGAWISTLGKYED